jgi:hypothetical protein
MICEPRRAPHSASDCVDAKPQRATRRPISQIPRDDETSLVETVELPSKPNAHGPLSMDTQKGAPLATSLPITSRLWSNPSRRPCFFSHEPALPAR